MKNLLKKQMRVILVLVWVLLIVSNTFAQDGREALTVRVDQIVSNNFPNMTVYAVVENARGEVVTGLSPGLFRFRINSLEETGRSTVTPFAMREPPIDFSIIFSNSGIMEGAPLDFQKTAILQFIETMKDTDRLSLYTVGTEANVIFEELRRDQIDPSVINSVTVSVAQPRLYDSIINVMRRVQRRQIERRVVIVISDGRDQNSRFTVEQLHSVVSEVGVPIYALGFRVLGAQSLANLHQLADFTGGTYLFTPQFSGIPAGLRSLVDRITQAYIINIRTRSLRADNLPHIFEVLVDGRDFVGSGQKTFIAVRVPVPRWMRWVILAIAIVVMAVLTVLFIISRITKRKRMGITRRRCSDCRNRMKDTWDTCPFCRYLPNIKKVKKKQSA